MQQPKQKPTHKRGWLSRLRILFLGDRPKDLEEETHHAPPASYVLMLLESVAVVLVLGHTSVVRLLDGSASFSEHVVSAAAIMLLVLSVVVADYAFIKSFGRLAALHRNRSGLYWEHLAYMGFLLIIELITLGLVFSALDKNAASLISNNGPQIIPTSGPFLSTQVWLRAGLVIWTVVQVLIVAQKLATGPATVDRRVLQRLGGHVQGLLDDLQLTQTDLASAIRAVAIASEPPPRRPNLFNGWLVHRDELTRLANEEHQERLMQSLQLVTGSREQDVERLQMQIVTLERELEAERADKISQIAKGVALALLYFSQHREFPPELVEIEPRLAEIGVSGAVKLRAMPKTAVATGRPTKGALQEELLELLGIEKAPRPSHKNGVWLTAKQISALIAKPYPGDVTKWLQIAGGGAKSRVAYAAPFEVVMRQLHGLGILSEPARIWWEQSGVGMSIVQDGNGGESSVESGGYGGTYEEDDLTGS